MSTPQRPTAPHGTPPEQTARAHPHEGWGPREEGQQAWNGEDTQSFPRLDLSDPPSTPVGPIAQPPGWSVARADQSPPSTPAAPEGQSETRTLSPPPPAWLGEPAGSDAQTTVEPTEDHGEDRVDDPFEERAAQQDRVPLAMSLPSRGSGRKPPLRLVIGAAAVVVVAVVAVLGLVTPGFLRTPVFDPAALQQGVARVLTQDYHLPDVGSITCAGDIAVTAGSSFQCDATVDGLPVKVPVTVTGDDGSYRVSRPVAPA